MATITTLNAPVMMPRPGGAVEGDSAPRSGASVIANREAVGELPNGALPGQATDGERQSFAAARTDAATTEAIDAAVGAAVDRLNEQASSLKRSLRFSVDRETGRTIIKVVDRDTDEVIRQIPPEYTMEILRRMDVGAGLILREKA